MPIAKLRMIARTSTQRSRWLRDGAATATGVGAGGRGGSARGGAAPVALEAVSGAPHPGQLLSVPGDHIQHLVQTLSTTAG